ncbi:MAG: SDR family oxidoreductase [Rhodospirillales bacterium]|nr:SDR family oxidoreductase [Rhodospirillales bacterium]
MRIDFTGKRVVVCGASRGIGLAIAQGFAAAGAALSLCARGADGLAQARAAILATTPGARIHTAACDLADAAAIASYIPAAADALGGIDVLVNNASGFGASDDEAGWMASLDVDLMATVRATRAAEPFLLAARGVVVNTTSISALRPAARQPPYGAVKAAVNHYTATTAQRLARQGVRVNAVAPGSIEFPGGVWDQRRDSDPKLYAGTLRSMPRGRMGWPEEVANVVLFLASEQAVLINGQTLVADGGQMLGA